MDFVRNEHQVVFAAELREARDGVFRKNAADRIVRVAKDEKFALRCDSFFQRVEIDVPDTVAFSEVDFDQSDPGEFRRAQKWRIDRRAGEDFFAGLDKGAAGHVERRDESGEPNDLLRGNRAAMVRLQVFNRFIDRGLRGHGVAEHAVRGAFLQRGDDFRRGKKVHVGHPHGHDVASWVALPFERSGAAAVGAGGKIVFHGA